MRELKFRAWDKINACWVNIFDIRFALYGSVLCVGDVDGETYGLHQVELSQYTGLKDKNGKEIYEGDIVAWRYEDNEEAELLPIVFDTSTFGWQRADGFEAFISWYGSGCVAGDDMEVIGNVWENPELLKGDL